MAKKRLLCREIIIAITANRIKKAKKYILGTKMGMGKITNSKSQRRIPTRTAALKTSLKMSIKAAAQIRKKTKSNSRRLMQNIILHFASAAFHLMLVFSIFHPPYTLEDGSFFN